MLASLSKQRQKAEAQLLRAQTAEAYYQLLLKGSAAPQAAAAAAAAAASAAAAAAQKLLQCTVVEDSVRDTVRPADLLQPAAEPCAFPTPPVDCTWDGVERWRTWE